MDALTEYLQGADGEQRAPIEELRDVPGAFCPSFPAAVG
jgi:hypothetical protein